MTREEFLAQYKTKEWYEISKRIKARDHNTCQMCGRNDVPLSVHHLHYGIGGSIFDIGSFSLITLCDDCHKLNHLCRQNTGIYLRLLRGFITDYEINAILNSESKKYFNLICGTDVILESSLQKPTILTNQIDVGIDLLGNLKEHNLRIARNILIKNGRYKNDM